MKFKVLAPLICLMCGAAAICQILLKVSSTDDFRTSVVMFSFNLLPFDSTLAFLFILSISIPVIMLILLFGDIYLPIKTSKYFVAEIFLWHLFFCYLSVFLIFSIDFFNEQVFIYYNFDTKPKNYSKWNTYIFHSVLTPIFFIDAIYSIEVEQIKHDKNTNTSLNYSNRWYVFAQIIFIMYFLYGMLMVLFLDNQLIELFNNIICFKHINGVSKISDYLSCLVNDLMVCVFVSLITGIIDKGVAISRFTTMFKIYCEWTNNSSKKQ